MNYASSAYQGQKDAVLALYRRGRPVFDINPYPSPEKLEKALEGQSAGYAVSVTIPPADAFGEQDESLITSIPKSQFPPGVKVGGTLAGTDNDGHEHQFTVMKIKGDTVMLDGNHPLAGQTLKFELKVLDVRAASEEEIAHGHAHGDHGHHH